MSGRIRNYINPVIVYQPDEVFVSMNHNGIIKPRYQISNYGRVWDKAYCHFSRTFIDTGGYHRVHVGNNQYASIHRLVMMSFHPIENFDKMQVNHIDGNKNNNCLNNLEWLSPLENMRHAYKTGLNKSIADGNASAKLTNDQVKQICEMIDNGYTNNSINEALGINKNSSIVSNIRNGRSYLSISKNYKFMNKYDLVQYNINTIRMIFELLTDGNNYSYKDIMDILNIPYNQIVSLRTLIYYIRKGSTCKEYVRKYGMINPPTDYRKPLDALVNSLNI